MRSVPTTSLDLDRRRTSSPTPTRTSPRSAAATRSPGTSRPATYLTFSPRERAARCCATGDLGRLWHDREPAAYLEPFNLLHRNQMMENEPPEHTRLRRPVAGGVQPRARRAAAAAGAGAGGRAARRRSTRPAFDVVGDYAEPLPVLVIAELLGRPALARAATLRDWSQAIVRMYEPAPSAEVVDAAVRGRQRLRRPGPRARSPSARPSPGDDLISDLVGDRRCPTTRWWRRRSCCSTPATRRRSTCSATAWSRCSRAGCGPADDVGARRVEEMLRFDSALQLFERTATAPTSRSATSSVEPGQKIAALLGAANRDPAVFADADAVRRRPRPQPAPRLRRRRALLPGRAAGADGAGRVAAAAVRGVPGPAAGRRAGVAGHLRAARLPVGAGDRERPHSGG